jgi:hypothetical protein
MLLLEASVAALAFVLALLVLAIYRVAGNVGPLTLEEFAARNRCVYVPIAHQLAAELEKGWSKPLRMRLARNERHPVLAELICTSKLEDEQ